MFLLQAVPHVQVEQFMTRTPTLALSPRDILAIWQAEIGFPQAPIKI